MEQAVKKRNQSIDMMRLFAAFVVVGLHCGYPSILGGFNLALSRFAVPFFFVVSGYFWYSSDAEQRSKRAKNSFFRLIKTALIGYGVTWLYLFSLYNFNVVACFQDIPWSVEAFLNFFLFNDPSGFFILLEPMWFLAAIVYAYGVLFLLEKLNLKKGKYVLMAVMLVILLILCEFLPYFGIFIERRLYRNFLLTGVPFMLLGSFLKEYEEKLLKIKDVYLWGAIVIGAAYSVLMQKFVLPDFRSVSAEIYVGTVAITVALMLLCLKHPDAPTFLSRAGKKYSLSVYIVHPLVFSVFRRLFILKDWFSSSYFKLFYATLVFLVSLIVAILVGFLVDFVHKLRTKA